MKSSIQLFLLLCLCTQLAACPDWFTAAENPEEFVDVPLDQEESRELIIKSVMDSTFPNLFRFPTEEEIAENPEAEMRYLGFGKRIEEQLNMAPISFAFQKEALEDTCTEYYELGMTERVDVNIMSILNFWKNDSFDGTERFSLGSNSANWLYSVQEVIDRVDSTRLRTKVLTLPLMIDMMNFLESKVPQEFFVDLANYEVLNEEILAYANELKKHDPITEEILYMNDFMERQGRIMQAGFFLMEEFQQAHIFDFSQLLKLYGLQNEMSEEEQARFALIFHDAMKMARINNYKQVGELESIFDELNLEEDLTYEQESVPSYIDALENSYTSLAAFASTFDLENKENSIYQLCGSSLSDLEDHYSNLTGELGERELTNDEGAYQEARARRKGIFKMIQRHYANETGLLEQNGESQQ